LGSGAGRARLEKHRRRDRFHEDGKKESRKKMNWYVHNQWQVGSFHKKFAATADKKQGKSAAKFVLAKSYFWVWLWEEANTFGWLLSF
jgi:hypothetical protein